MRHWHLIAGLGLLVAACGVAWPGCPWPGCTWPSGGGGGACQGTDYSALSSCLGHWGIFTDGDIAKAELDRCDDPGQDGANPITWLAGVTVDDDNAPPGTPAGSDSTSHDDTDVLKSAGSIAAVPNWYTTQNLTVGGWYQIVAVDRAFWMWRWGPNVGANGNWALRMQWTPAERLRGLVNDTEQAAAGLGPTVPDGEWAFLAMSYDGTSTDTIRTFSSEGGLSGTLLDCDGTGLVACNTEAGPLTDWAPELIALNYDQSGNKRYNGQIGPTFYMNVALTSEQLCEICRCGFKGDSSEDRRALCNNCSMGTVALGPWPRAAWPGN